MKYNNILNNGTGVNTNKSNVNPLKIEQGNKNKGVNSLIKGQQITGQVVSVGDQITLDFGGQEVTTSNRVMADAKPGDVKKFEVVKANGKEIELRVLNETLSATGTTFKAVLKKDSDWESVLEQKKKNADKSEKEADINQTKNKINKLQALITEQDCAKLESAGYKLEDYTINALYSALKRIKKQEERAQQEQASGQQPKDAKGLGKVLKDNNLPATTDNLASLTKAMELTSSIQGMNDKSMQYLISTNSVPSIENIYKANYSQASINKNSTQPLSEDTWKELQGQVEDVIKSAGYEVNESSLKDARWLIENNLPMTEQTFTYKKNLDKLKESSDDNTILNKMVEGMKDGIDPKDVSLVEESTGQAKQLVDDVQSISDEAISKAVQDDDEITIRRLKTIQEGLSSVKKDDKGDEKEVMTPSGEDTKQTTVQEQKDQPQEITSKEYEEAKAKRQMEEIRLKMTLDAARQLEKKGIDVDTQSLEKVVEELRRIEEQYYQKVLQESDVVPSDSAVQILRDTSNSIEALRNMPSAILGSTLVNRTTQTIPGLLSEGSKLQAEYTKAGNAYELLATVPSAEYGDSIRKAFGNVSELLAQLGMEDTGQNQRAVRILGYNQMEITESSVNQVKAYDQQVTSLMQNLNPAVTVHMIKQGINPLDMTITDLNRTIDQMREEQGINAEDKYSVYLNKLEKQNGITEEERKAYIGIYRLLYNIEKSDGAVVGSVVKANREVTLNNLLTAIQTNKKGNLDAVINDEFGTLQSITQNKESIASQLSSFQNTGLSVEEQIEYADRVLKQLKDELSPVGLMDVVSKMAHSGMQKGKSDSAAPLLSGDKGVWDSIKNVSPEKLLEQLRQNGDRSAEGDYTSKVNELREMCKNAEQAIRFLKDFRMPSTPANMMMTSQILSNGESAIKRLLNLEKERKVEKSENDIKNPDDLSDKLIDSQTMKEAYEQLDTQAKSAVVQACSGEQIDSSKLAQLKSIGQQITFAKALAQSEFYQIPIETKNGITNMNLTIHRGAKESGRVSVSLSSERLGNVKADFVLKEDKIMGFLGSDKKDGLDCLRQNMGELENAAQEHNVTIKHIDYGVLQRDSDTYNYSNTESDGNGTSISTDTERILYRIAKSVVQTVRIAENSETAVDKAVS